MEREYYYYERDPETGKPIITRCLVVANGHHARGTAICSEKDNPSKAVGRKIARGRAWKALALASTTGGIHRIEALHRIWRVPNNNWFDLYDFKSEYCPPMTDLEKRLIGNKTIG